MRPPSCAAAPSACARIAPAGRPLRRASRAPDRAGRLLVATAEDIARRWGCLALEVTSARSRPQAHPFYRRLGFSDICDRSARYWKALS
jgi:GNAT superfamily N-acetyltransferase